MFSQIAIVIIGLFLVVVGIRSGDILNVGMGASVGVTAESSRSPDMMLAGCR